MEWGIYLGDVCELVGVGVMMAVRVLLFFSISFLLFIGFGIMFQRRHLCGPIREVIGGFVEIYLVCSHRHSVRRLCQGRIIIG